MSKVAPPLIGHSPGLHIASARCSLAAGNDVYLFGNAAWPVEKITDDEEILPGKAKFVQSLMKRNDSFTLEYCNKPTTRYAVDMLSHMVPPEMSIGYMTMNGKTTPLIGAPIDPSLPTKRPSKLRESSTQQFPFSAHIREVEKPKGGRKTTSASVYERETYTKEAFCPPPPTRENKQVAHGACNHCGETESPQWRKGPADKPHLCNACGTRYLRTGSLKRSGARRSGQPKHSLEGRDQAVKRARISGSGKSSPRTSSDESS